MEEEEEEEDTPSTVDRLWLGAGLGVPVALKMVVKACHFAEDGTAGSLGGGAMGAAAGAGGAGGGREEEWCWRPSEPSPLTPPPIGRACSFFLSLSSSCLRIASYVS